MINVVAVGLGRMGLAHSTILRALADVRVIGVIEPSRSLMTDIIGDKLRSFSIFTTYEDFEASIGSARVDALVVATPPHSHYEIVRVGLDKQMAIFCEKPFCSSLNEAASLRDRVEKLGLVNYVGYVNRFNPVFMYVRKIMAALDSADLIAIESTISSNTITRPIESSGWRGEKNKSGGALYEMGSHAIDLINYFVEGEPERIVGRVRSVMRHDVVDFGVIGFSKGSVHCAVKVNWCDVTQRKPVNKVEVVYRNARIIADQYTVEVFLSKPLMFEDLHLDSGWTQRKVTDLFSPVSFYLRGYEFTSQLEHFIQDVRRRQQSLPAATFRSATLVHQILEQVGV
jgi:predicted dehydrogenase